MADKSNVFMLCTVILFVLAGAGFVRAEDVILITDFENEADSRFVEGDQVSIVEEHAKTGTHALKVVHAGGNGYPGLPLEAGDVLKLIKANLANNPILAVDIYNPLDVPITFSASSGDNQTKDYGSRFNEDAIAAKPGWSTYRVNLTGLLCSNSRNFSQRRPLDASQLRFFKLFLCPHNRPEPLVLYFDNVRLEGHGLPAVKGLKAFDIGPAGSGAFPGFAAVGPDKVFKPGGGFGWRNPLKNWFRSVTNPDDLAGDFGSGGAFTVELPAGAYVVHVCIDQFGEWGTPPKYTSRTLKLNGKTVFNETVTGQDFLRKRYLRFENDEDTPWTDLWEDRVKKALPIRTFDCEVGADGLLSISVQAQGGHPATLGFAVVYPAAQKEAGQAFMAALDKKRKEAFNNAIVYNVPKAEGPAPQAAAKDTARGFIPFVRHTQLSIKSGAVPAAEEIGAGLVLASPAGEREAAQIGLYPLKEVSGLKVTVSDLAGPDQAAIPADAMTIMKIRNFASRAGVGKLVNLVPRILQPFDSLALKPGLTRGLWLTLKVPAGTSAGEYKGTVSITGAGSQTAIPITVTVLPFSLEKADDITIGCTGTRAAPWRGWYTDLEELWWQIAEKAIADQAEHGMNALTGGPGFKLQAIENGKARIDFTDADRWMALAVKYGLTRRGDSYQGFDVRLGFRADQGPDCMAVNDARAKKHWGIPYAELIKIVYAEIESHGREAGWPPRSYYLLDEPRPEHRNVQSALEFLKLHCAAAPDTRWTGYYSPGSGRDPYFKTAPISIAHHSAASLAACVKAGKEGWTYSGGGRREDIGRWLFVAREKGLTGFLRNGYMYVNPDPYYDFSDVEGAWSQVWPTADGIAPTLNWERTAQGIMDYRYLKTLRSRINAAKGDPAKTAAAQAAKAFLNETLKGIQVGRISTAKLPVKGWIKFRSDLIHHLTALF